MLSSVKLHAVGSRTHLIPDVWVCACERGGGDSKAPAISYGKWQRSLHITQRSGHRFAVWNSSFQGSFPFFGPLAHFQGPGEILASHAIFTLLLKVGLLFFFLTIFPTPLNLDVSLSPALLFPDHPSLFLCTILCICFPIPNLHQSPGYQVSWTQETTISCPGNELKETFSQCKCLTWQEEEAGWRKRKMQASAVI